ncbi:MAG: DotI/IcmL/TraM family protein [Alphaproteobacteria bacterium]|nr:DotI/IcmL/TraM family protein [Alphaproteobacteria bacterium]MBU0858940.1 DotI/IcmL/TraM family protein [Alphaproteobacteria bacterium]
MKRLLVALSLTIIVGAPAQAQTSPESVKNWVAQSLPGIFDFNGATYEEEKKNDRLYFTKDGHKSFYSAIEISRMPQMIAQNQQAVKIRKLCVVDAQAPPQRKNEWIVQTDMLLDFIAPQRTRTDRWSTTIIITEDPGQPHPFKIAQFIAQPAKADFNCVDPAQEREKAAAHRQKLEQEIKRLQAELNQLDSGAAPHNPADALTVP